MGCHAVVQAVVSRIRLCHHLARVKVILSSEASGMMKTVKIGIGMIVAGEEVEEENGSEEMGKQTKSERYRCCGPQRGVWEDQEEGT
jgi:hypothetical protein